MTENETEKERDHVEDLTDAVLEAANVDPVMLPESYYEAAVLAVSKGLKKAALQLWYVTALEPPPKDKRKNRWKRSFLCLAASAEQALKRVREEQEPDPVLELPDGIELTEESRAAVIAKLRAKRPVLEWKAEPYGHDIATLGAETA